MNLLPFFMKRDTTIFLDWFGMILIGSDTNIVNRNSSDWLGINSYPILSPGQLQIFSVYCILFSLILVSIIFYSLLDWYLQ